MLKNKAVIFDVDGTLAIMGNRSPYDWSSVGIDKVHEDIVALVRILNKWGYKILIVTGRDGSCLELTEKWLVKNEIPYDEIFTRPEGSFEKDYVIKERIYREDIEPLFDVEYVFDDRDQVVKVWRELGLRCLQVAKGNF